VGTDSHLAGTQDQSLAGRHFHGMAVARKWRPDELRRQESEHGFRPLFPQVRRRGRGPQVRVGCRFALVDRPEKNRHHAAHSASRPHHVPPGETKPRMFCTLILTCPTCGPTRGRPMYLTMKCAGATAVLVLAASTASANEKVVFGTNWLAQAEHGGY